MDHSYFSHSASPGKPICTYSGSEWGPNSKQNNNWLSWTHSLGSKGRVVTELDDSHDLEVQSLAGTLDILDGATCCHQLLARMSPTAEQSRNFLSRNINFFAIIHGNQINLGCGFLYLGPLWRAYSPIHLWNEHSQSTCRVPGRMPGGGRWAHRPRMLWGPVGPGEEAPVLPGVEQRGAWALLPDPGPLASGLQER